MISLLAELCAIPCLHLGWKLFFTSKPHKTASASPATSSMIIRGNFGLSGSGQSSLCVCAGLIPEYLLSSFGFLPLTQRLESHPRTPPPPTSPPPLDEVQGHVLCAFSPRAWLCYSCASCECLPFNCTGCTDHVVFIPLTCPALPPRLTMFLCFCFSCRDCGGSGKRKSGEDVFFFFFSLMALHCA